MVRADPGSWVQGGAPALHHAELPDAWLAYQLLPARTGQPDSLREDLKVQPTLPAGVLAGVSPHGHCSWFISGKRGFTLSTGLAQSRGQPERAEGLLCAQTHSRGRPG